MIVAVLTSAAASTQTTILPTSRTALSMARVEGAPRRRSRHMHPRYLTPDVATSVMGALSIAWYVGLTIVSENMLYDSIAALGLMIAFYYGLTGFACTWYYRRTLTTSLSGSCSSASAPFTGGAILLFVFVRSCIDLGRADAGSTTYFGIGSPLVIGVGFLLLGGRADGHLAPGGPPRVLRSPPEAAEPERGRRRRPALVAGELEPVPAAA